MEIDETMNRLEPNDPRIRVLASEVRYMQQLLEEIGRITKSRTIRDNVDEIDIHLRLLIDYMLMDASDPRLRRVNEK
jgi:transcription initiation factor TFIIIB Brf1 subunit/transcription initiation factor TFIIB